MITIKYIPIIVIYYIKISTISMITIIII